MNPRFFVQTRLAPVIQPMITQVPEGVQESAPFSFQISGTPEAYVPTNPDDPKWQEILPYLMQVGTKPPPFDGYSHPVEESVHQIDRLNVNPLLVAESLFEYLMEVGVNLKG